MILQGDCLERMAELDEASIDAVVCDPPYGLEFMGKKWDRLGDAGQVSHSGFADEPGFKGFRLASYTGSGNLKCRRCKKWTYDHPGRKCECPTPDVDRARQPRLMQEWHLAWATEALRVLKPGGHLLAFGGSRTFHRLACAIEDAGFEIRDSILNAGGGDATESPGFLAWIYGSGLPGFPKSLNVTKALEAQIPAHERCACAPRSTGTTEGSRGDYQSRPHSDGGQPHPTEGDGQAPAPSPADARGRSRGDQPRDGRDEARASSGPDGETARPSTGDSQLPSEPRSADSPARGSKSSDTASSARTSTPRSRRPASSGGRSSRSERTPMRRWA